MPYPTQITLESIIAIARPMIEHDGVDSLSLNKLSKELGVKTPSLYRYIKNRADLLRVVIDDTLKELSATLGLVVDETDTPRVQLIEVALAYRRFAHANPICYGLAFTNTIVELQPDHDEQVQAVLPYQAIMAKISGDDNSLTAFRGYLALTHGFVMLELANKLQRGGDLDAAFRDSIAAYLSGWQLT